MNTLGIWVIGSGMLWFATASTKHPAGKLLLGTAALGCSVITGLYLVYVIKFDVP